MQSRITQGVIALLAVLAVAASAPMASAKTRTANITATTTVSASTAQTPPLTLPGPRRAITKKQTRVAISKYRGDLRSFMRRTLKVTTVDTPLALGTTTPAFDDTAALKIFKIYFQRARGAKSENCSYNVYFYVLEQDKRVVHNRALSADPDRCAVPPDISRVISP